MSNKIQVEKFLSKKTISVSKSQTETSLQFPAITLCSNLPYKKKGYHFTKEAFNEYAYSWEEMFYNSTAKVLADKVLGTSKQHTFNYTST